VVIEWRGPQKPITSSITRFAASYEHWVAEIDGKFRKVTVDCPKAPFSPDLIGSMAKQAGVTKKQVYEIHFSM
jgi:hypothetical protein